MTKEHIEDTVETFIAPGTLLQEARKEQGLSLEDISSRLRLRVEVLEQIEADQFDMGKLATFTRGYYRSYAKVVNIPDQIVLDALDQLGKAQIEQHDMQSFSRKTKREKHDNRIMKLTWVIFAIILGMSVLWWWQEQAQLETNKDAELVVEPAAVTSMEPTAENTMVTPQVTDVAQAFSDTDTEQVTTPNTPQETEEKTSELATEIAKEADVTHTPDTATPETAATQVEEKAAESVISEPVVTEDIVMTFSSDCWLQVQDAANNRLYSGVKKSNQTLKLTGKAPYKLVIGAPNAITLTYKGKPVDLSGYPTGKVARLTLPQ